MSDVGESQNSGREIWFQEILGEGVAPGLSSVMGSALASAACVCLEYMEHEPGVALAIQGGASSEQTLYWIPLTEQDRRTMADLQEATEWGAAAIAIVLIQTMTDYTVVERAAKGGGFDYWLGLKDDPGPLFQNKIRLEVSGILQGNASSIGTRVRQKMTQTKQSAGTETPAKVAVVEFGAPLAHVVEVGA